MCVKSGDCWVSQGIPQFFPALGATPLRIMALSGLTNAVPTNVRRKDGIDLLDSLLAPLFVAATFVVSGLGTIGIDDPFDWYMSDAIYSAHGTEFTWAFVITMIVIATAWVSNDQTSLDDYTDEELAVMLAMFILNILAALVPAVNIALASYWWLGLFTIMLNGAGFYLLAYR